MPTPQSRHWLRAVLGVWPHRWVDINPPQLLNTNPVSNLANRVAICNEPFFDQFLAMDLHEVLAQAGFEVVTEVASNPEIWPVLDDAPVRIMVMRKPLFSTVDTTPGLEYASSCFLPTSWLDLPLIERTEVNHDTTRYAFQLPAGKSLNLPVCACILMLARGRGRKEGGGKDDWDGSDAVRPYTPMSDNSVLGKFELLVKRYDGGAASMWLHGLQLGAKVIASTARLQAHSTRVGSRPNLPDP